MALYTTSLNSGSNGNCYYIGNNTEAVLIDAGISCRETEKRMIRLGLSIQKVKAIFISHEHSDHIRGVEALSKKYNLPVYITNTTLQYSKLCINESLVKTFNAYQAVSIGEFSVVAFPKQHDASDPFSFVVADNEVKIGVFTDIGYACAHVIENFKQCHAVFLEANYDEHILEKGSYPYHLKKRIRGGKGHLSNHQALELFNTHRPAFMSHVFLSHLSEDNNCPILVKDLFSKYAINTKIIVASRYSETEIYKITQCDITYETTDNSFIERKPQLIQMTLF